MNPREVIDKLYAEANSLEERAYELRELASQLERHFFPPEPLTGIRLELMQATMRAAVPGMIKVVTQASPLLAAMKRNADSQ